MQGVVTLSLVAKLFDVTVGDDKGGRQIARIALRIRVAPLEMRFCANRTLARRRRFAAARGKTRQRTRLQRQPISQLLVDFECLRPAALAQLLGHVCRRQRLQVQVDVRRKNRLV